MHKSKTVNKQVAVIRAEWFKNHEAFFYAAKQEPEKPHFARLNPVGILSFRAPNTSNYSLTYIIMGRTLHVHGDLGEASYQWSEVITWEFLAGCDFGYFHGKCEASESGKRFLTWDATVCMDQAKQYLIDNEIKGDHEELLREAVSHMGSAQEWSQFVYNDAPHFMDDDYSIMDAGHIPNCRAVAHWVGIKMAMEQRRKA